MELAGDFCNNTVDQLFKKFNLDLHKEYDSELHLNLSKLCGVAYEKDVDDLFSGPLVWIGVYIAIGSALCILKLVVADLLSDARRARQIPYKWFSLNAATITVLGIAMKLPLDMTGSMPGLLDQTTKLGSLVFMCTMLANLIPNLASMDVKTLKSNLVALAILVITIIVNILVEIFTGVIGHRVFDKLKDSKLTGNQYMMSRKMPYRLDNYFVNMAIVYTVWLFFLLMASVSAAVAIPSMKKVLESQYQVRREALSKEPTTLVELEQHVTRYWIMAKTGSPQLVLIASPLTVASGAICIASTITYAELIRRLINSIVASEKPLSDYLGSDYEWSMLFILITQGIGIIVGDITLAQRYVNSTRIKLTSSYSLRVEKFWYVILFEWKGRHIAFPKGGLKRRTYVHTVKNSFLNLCIPIQVFVIQICKIIGLIPFIITRVIKMILCRHVPSREDQDLINNVLQVEDKVKNDEYALHFLLKIKDGLDKKAKKKDTSNLLWLLRKSNGFKAEGQKFAIDQVQIPPSVMLESWSLPVITLTCIAMVVPDSQDQINWLIKSVDQALVYAHLVEESFNSEHEYANMHKTTMDIWYEVKDACKWLKNSLRRDAFQDKTPTQILEWFDRKAEAAIGTSNSTVVVDVETEPLENYPDRKLICNSMQSISRSILSEYENGSQPSTTTTTNPIPPGQGMGRSQLSTKVDFFELLSSMIADILFACFSNIPQAITKKCQVKEIEKREASVEAAVKILARTTKILEMFGTPKLPVLDRDKMASIDDWRHPLIQPPTDPELSAGVKGCGG